MPAISALSTSQSSGMRRRVRAEDQLLRGRGAFDHVVRATEIGGDELALGQAQRLDQVRREEAVLRDDARGERQFRDAVRDEVEVGGLLRVLAANSWKKPVSSTQW
jgi:hypothetical protein